MSQLRSAAAIGAGIAVTGLLMQFTVDPVRAAILRVALDDPVHKITGSDWVYLTALNVARYGPFAVGGMLAGVMAPPDRTMHALVAVDLAIVLWLLGVY